MARGDHVKVTRRGYTHHGIDLGDGTFIHLSGEPAGGKASAEVRIDPWEVFGKGGKFSVRRHVLHHDPDAVVARAMSKLGQREYGLRKNNCEHFAHWCVTGKSRSEQVETAASGAGVAGAAAAAAGAAAGTMAAAGSVAGVSGAGIMSGLATAGALVGGGVVAGLGILGAGPGLVSAAIMGHALKDDEDRPDDERKARAAGRLGTAAGLGAGTAGSIGAVSALGVSGLSATGITSGLAAVGGAVGGGMFAGTVIVAAAPAVATAAVGYGVYRVVRHVTKPKPPSALAPGTDPDDPEGGDRPETGGGGSPSLQPGPRPLPASPSSRPASAT